MAKHQYKKKSRSRSKTQTGGGSHVFPISTPRVQHPSTNSAADSNTNTLLLSSIIGVVVIVLLAIIIYLIYQSVKQNSDNIHADISNSNGSFLASKLSSSSIIPNKASTLQTLTINDAGTVVSIAHPELAGHRIVSGDADNPRQISYWDYLNKKDHERIINPLLPPERSYENTYGIPINIPSRGFSGGFQQVGTLYKNDIADTDKTIGNSPDTVIIPIYGRPLYPGANKWNYYITSDKYAMVKMPFMYQGRKSDDQYGVNEIMDGDIIKLPEYNGDFVVKIYQYDKPRYIPFIY